MKSLDKPSFENKSYKEILDSLSYGVCRVDKDKRVLYMNTSAQELLGINNSEIVGKRFNFCLGKFCPVSKSLKLKSKITLDSYLRRKGNQAMPVSLAVTPNFDKDGSLLGAVIAMNDNTAKVALKKKARELENVVSIDFLTGLNNRMTIESEIYKRVDEFNRYGKVFGVIMFDIDYFKKINDVYGHSAGDIVLKSVSGRIAGSLRPFDSIGRWGGEEFVVVLSNIDKFKLRSITSRLRRLAEESSFFIDGKVIKITISLGATLVKDNDNINSIIKRVDSLMYKSKNLGRNSVSVEA